MAKTPKPKKAVGVAPKKGISEGTDAGLPKVELPKDTFKPEPAYWEADRSTAEQRAEWAREAERREQDSLWEERVKDMGGTTNEHLHNEMPVIFEQAKGPTAGGPGGATIKKGKTGNTEKGPNTQ